MSTKMLRLFLGLSAAIPLGCSKTTGEVYYLVFEGDEISGTGGRCLMRGTIDGGDNVSQKPLTTPGEGDVQSFSHSPDGSKFILSYQLGGSSWGQGDTTLYAVNADGSGPHALPGTVSWPVYPAFLSNDRVVFGAWDQSSSTENLYTVNLDGSDLQLLADNLPLAGPIAVSPDQTKLAVLAYSAGAACDTVVIDAASGQATPIKHYDSTATIPTLPLLFHPDGNHIIYAAPDGDPDGGGIHVMSLDGTGDTVISTIQPNTMALTPDDRLVLAVGSVFEISLDGSGEPVILAAAVSASQAVITGGGDYVAYIVVDPDSSQWLHFRTVGDESDHRTQVTRPEGIWSLHSIF